MGRIFEDAMGLVRSGSRVRRESWPSAWLFLAEGGPADGPDKVYLVEKHPGEKGERSSEFVAREADVQAADWVVVGGKASPAAAPPAPDPPAKLSGPTNEDFLRGVPSGGKTATEVAHAANAPARKRLGSPKPKRGR